jgi:hypothetical protein
VLRNVPIIEVIGTQTTTMKDRNAGPIYAILSITYDAMDATLLVTYRGRITPSLSTLSTHNV